MLSPEAGDVADAEAGLSAARGCDVARLDVAKIIDEQIAKGRVVCFTRGGTVMIHKPGERNEGKKRMWSKGRASSAGSWRRGEGQDDALSPARFATAKQRRDWERNSREEYIKREERRSREAEAAKQRAAAETAAAESAATETGSRKKKHRAKQKNQKQRQSEAKATAAAAQQQQ